MTGNAAVKEEFNGGLNSVYDEELHARFILYKDQSGSSLTVLAGKINRSTAAISQYTNKNYKGNVPELEKDIRNLLDREEDVQFVSGPKEFVSTTVSTLIWEVFQYCDQNQKMGAALAPSGTGKSETCKEYKRQNRATVLISLNTMTKSPHAVLKAIIERVGGVGRRSSGSEYLESLISRLKGSNRLLLIDEAHFMTWEAFELIRALHDCAGIGVCYVGQERLYQQMRGTEGKAYLFDQIYSRIAIKRDSFKIIKRDAKAIIDSHCPGLSKECIDYLFERAKGKGRFRYVTDLLEVALKRHNEYGIPLGVPLLMEAEKFKIGQDGN